jgi:protocatechuate 3,4-dioxygenase, beta subunit
MTDIMSRNNSQRILKRRTVSAAALIAMPAIWLGVRAQPTQKRRATPSQTEGPFYPVTFPKDSDYDLLRIGSLNYSQGRSTWVTGSVVDTDGKAVNGAQVEIWQCDHKGNYHHPGDGGRADAAFQGFGRVQVGADGQYRFRTIQPVAYGGRTPHIHVKVKLGSRELLTTQMYIAGEPLNERDFLWRGLRNADDRAALTVPFSNSQDGLQAQFPIVVEI